MWGMKHVGLFTHQHEWDVELLGNRGIRRWLQHCAEILAERAGDRHVRLVAEQDVLVLPIDSRKMPQEVANVGADPEVVEFSGINRDFHCRNSTSLSLCVSEARRCGLSIPT